MDRIACMYFEGNDSKITLFKYEEGSLTLLKAESIDTSLAFAEQPAAPAGSTGKSRQQETYNYNFVDEETSTLNKTLLQKLNEFFRGEDLNKCRFIPILTEPALYFQKVNDKKDFSHSSVNDNGKIATIVDFFDLYDNSKLAVYPSGKSSYLQVMDSLARMNSMRFLRIPAVKSAEISLASYVGRKKQLSDDETTLILYVGKEYSKLIFLQGKKLFHIGSTVSVGKNSFDAHNVIVRKILLEMEHVSLSNIDNIVVCGEDNSEDLISVMSETYPRSQVSIQGIESVEDGNISGNKDAFIVPVAVAEEYLAELDKKFTGINLLPQYIKEEQKPIQLDWQGYVTIGLIGLSTILFSARISSNAAIIQSKDKEITRIRVILEQNRELLNKIKSLEDRIQNVDKTKAVLNQLSTGSGILSTQMRKLSGFTGRKGNLWISQVTIDPSRKLKLTGYTFSRLAAKELSDSYDNSLLQHMIFDPLRETRAFKFSVNTDIK